MASEMMVEALNQSWAVPQLDIVIIDILRSTFERFPIIMGVEVVRAHYFCAPRFNLEGAVFCHESQFSKRIFRSRFIQTFFC